MTKRIIFVVFLILLFLWGFGLGNYIKRNYFADLKNREGRTNFLLLGIRGFAESDADLADSIIFVSLDRQARKGVLISIPRDLWIPEIQAKINTVYHYGGFDLAKKTVSETLGQPIDYMIVINFESFGKIIDGLGGVTVNVQRSFDDFRYPIAGKENDTCNGDKEFKCRYEHVHFEAGPQVMDGQTALKYVRSRNAEGEEGSDFSRLARQQQLFRALEQKIFSPEVYLRPDKLYRLFKVSQEYLTVDINRPEYGTLALLLAKVNWKQMKVTVIDDTLLTNPKDHYSKQWVLVPKTGNWEEIHQFVDSLLK